MRTPEYSSQFKRDYKKVKSHGKDMSVMKAVMDLLLMEKSLPKKYKDHQLKGEWKLFRELHLESDWLLVYRIAENTVYFTRTGTHSDILDE